MWFARILNCVPVIRFCLPNVNLHKYLAHAWQVTVVVASYMQLIPHSQHLNFVCWFSQLVHTQYRLGKETISGVTRTRAQVLHYKQLYVCTDSYHHLYTLLCVYTESTIFTCIKSPYLTVQPFFFCCSFMLCSCSLFNLS